MKLFQYGGNYFKYYLTNNNLDYKLFLPRNQKDVDKVVLELMKQDEGK